MSFLNPAFLGALALIGIPLFIHLLRRRKLTVVRWAAMEFLRQSQEKQSRRLRIEELILLFLRMAIVMFACLAFARPVLRVLGLPLLAQNARIYAVIVIDNSFSMGHRGVDGLTSFDRAQAAAKRIVEQVLKPGDSASLVLLSDQADPVVGAASFDLALVGRRARAARVSDQATDFLAGAQKVAALLRASHSPAREVYWLTDDQARGWSTSRSDAARAVWQAVGAQARVNWISVGAPAGSRDNLAVEPPMLSGDIVTPQLPARIEARVVNYGARPRNDLLVNLEIDGKPAGATRVSVSAGDAAVARFVTTFGQPGIHTGRISLADPERIDGLPRDNSAPFVVRSRERIRLLVQDSGAGGARCESFYLMTALAPGGQSASFVPRLHTGAGLGTVNLRDFDVVVLTGLGPLADADRRALADYVRSGGGLLVFPGPGTSGPRANADLISAGLLPARLGARQSFGEDLALSLNPATIAHPALSLFRDTSTLNLGSARFLAAFALDPVLDADAGSVRVMVRFSNNAPAFVERKVGLGRVILAASSAATTWNQLPLKPSYVPLIYQLSCYLGQGPDAERNLRQKQPLALSLPLADANRPIRVTAPDGRASIQHSVLDARGVTFTYAATDEAGFYTVGVGDGPAVEAFAVGLEPTESDLSPAEPAQAVTRAGVPAGHLTLARGSAEIEASVHRARYGAEIWRTLIWLLIPMLFVESLIAQRFGRRG